MDNSRKTVSISGALWTLLHQNRTLQAVRKYDTVSRYRPKFPRTDVEDSCDSRSYEYWWGPTIKCLASSIL